MLILDISPFEFYTAYDDILDQLEYYDPSTYAKSRNYLNGNVSYLSPYISRGVISTKQVYDKLKTKNLKYWQVEKYVQELAWREYWQHIWNIKGCAINADLNFEQKNVQHHQMPAVFLNAKSQIDEINRGIERLYSTGYIHNHMRMYLASLICNRAGAHWFVPAKWMYYNLMDADWASNALSWQWVAGCMSNKKYLFNQDNLNTYSETYQKGTYIDHSYEKLESYTDVPEELKPSVEILMETWLPEKKEVTISSNKKTLIYNFYNLDPDWRKDETANRILLLEPSVFQEYPVCKESIYYTLELANNIPDIQVFVGEFDELQKLCGGNNIYFKQHPLNDYSGHEDQRDWMFELKEEPTSFFRFWKECKKQLKQDFEFVV